MLELACWALGVRCFSFNTTAGIDVDVELVSERGLRLRLNPSSLIPVRHPTLVRFEL